MRVRHGCPDRAIGSLTKQPQRGLLSLQAGPDQAPMYNDYIANKHQYWGATDSPELPDTGFSDED